MYIDSKCVNTQMVMLRTKFNVGWLGQLGSVVEESLSTWGMFIEVQIPGAQKPSFGYHCTMIYDTQCYLNHDLTCLTSLT